MSAGVAVEAISLTLGAFRLERIDLALSAGEILVILGPNGAGKSVTLETIAGFHRPASGRVCIGGRDVTDIAPERRNIGFVVQNFGLFPHLNVEQNVAIARRGDRALAAGGAGPPIHGDTTALLAYFGVAHLALRAPSELSPGEKQRVALARALAGAPDLFLFDEPFAALDSQAREQLRDELKSFLRALAIPAIFVTHDHADAVALADQIVVLRDGALVQRGPAAEILRRPINSFVARFVAVDNILDARLVEETGGLAVLAVGERTLRAQVPAQSRGAGQMVKLGIRAEDVGIVPPDAGSAAPLPGFNRLDGKIVALRHLSPLVKVEIDCGFPLKAYVLAPQAREMNLGLGHPIAVQIAAEAVHVMPD
jgi:molybdate/tungstate transport system ATP-binding protein